MAKAGGTTAKQKGTPKRKPSRSKAAKGAKEGKQTPVAATVNRAEEYLDIYNSWRRGIDPTTIAAKRELSPRRVREIIDQMRNGELASLDLTSKIGAVRFTEDLMVRMEYAISEAADLTEKALKDSNWAAALGGMKRQADARRELLEIRQERGLVPRNLGLLEWTEDSIKAAEGLLTLFKRHNIPEPVVEEFVRMMELGVRRDSGGVLQLDLGDPFDGEEGELVNAEVVG